MTYLIIKKFITNDCSHFVFGIINLDTHPYIFFIRGVVVMVLNYSFSNRNVLHLLYELLAVDSNKKWKCSLDLVQIGFLLTHCI